MPSPLYDGMDWFYNEQTGQIQHIHGDPVAGVATNPEWYIFASNTDERRFKTQADAQAYAKAHPAKKGAGSLSGVPGLGNVAGKIPGAGTTITSVTDAVSKLSGLALDFEDGNMWVSIGWLMAGVILTATGLMLLFRRPIEQGISAGGRVAAAL